MKVKNMPKHKKTRIMKQNNDNNDNTHHYYTVNSNDNKVRANQCYFRRVSRQTQVYNTMHVDEGFISLFEHSFGSPRSTRDNVTR